MVWFWVSVGLCLIGLVLIVRFAQTARMIFVFSGIASIVAGLTVGATLALEAWLSMTEPKALVFIALFLTLVMGVSLAQARFNLARTKAFPSH